MKVRLGFVTNSSSSSFLIAKKNLTPMQVEAIKHHIQLAARLDNDKFGWPYEWDIEENEDFITGYTYIDNFSMIDFLDYIGVPERAVTWGENMFELADIEPEQNDVSHEWEEILKEIMEVD